jgi:cellulose synthase/poly-beta-1,6-N-acetylglucosamine synthase-like glycosyltransferase
VLARTLDHLLAADYPRELVQIVLVVSDDEVDRETRAIAEDYASRFQNIKCLAPRGSLRSKPISLEDARVECTGDLVGVMDAESLVAPGLLGYVNTLASRRPGIGIFQGGVQLMNFRAAAWKRPPDSNWVRAAFNWFNSATSWWRARNCLEYYVWFMSRLRYQAEVRFIPLGGNTVFVRRDVLAELGGWDVSCLTEDCDLGVRASVHGVKIEVFYHPALSTREETPESLTKLIVQRTRWMMGFVQVLQKREWRRLPGLRQRALAIEMLAMPFFQAFSGLILPLSIALTFLLDAPVGLVIFFYLPLGVTVMLFLVEQSAFREFTHAYGLKATVLDSVRLVLLSPVYQFVLSVAAVRATARLIQGKVDWEKTSHLGAHHAPAPRAVELEGVS